MDDSVETVCTELPDLPEPGVLGGESSCSGSSSISCSALLLHKRISVTVVDQGTGVPTLTLPLVKNTVIQVVVMTRPIDTMVEQRAEGLAHHLSAQA